MSDSFTPVLRALVAATLLLACVAVMLVTVTRATRRRAGDRALRRLRRGL